MSEKKINLKEHFTTYKKQYIIASVIILVCAIIYGVYSMSSQNKIHIKNKEMVIEYGEPVPNELQDYVDFEKTDSTLTNEINLDLSSIELVEEKEYAKLGEYPVVISYGKETHTITLKVKDTVAPKFVELQESIEVVKECKPDDYSTMFNVEDIDNTEINVDDSQVDYLTVGEYDAKVTAKDSSGNVTEETIKIKVIDPTITLNQESIELTEGETSKLEATVKGKEETVTYSSSDESIATVNEEGTVTAIKEGTTTIKVNANGVEASCEVKVKAKAVVNKSSNSSSNVSSGSSSVGGNSNSGNNSFSGGSVNNGGGSSSNGGSVELSYDYASAKQAFDLQNQKRSENGLKPLIWNEELYNAAKVRAKEIVTNWSHTRPNGDRGPDSLIPTLYGGIGENLAKGSKTSSSVVNGWMNSSGHRANILDNYFVYGAVARYGDYWVTIFAEEKL